MIKIAVALLLAALAPAAYADIVEFDVPGLTGNSADSLQTSSFVYNGPPAAVNAVSVRVAGEVTDLGEICCGGPGLCPGPTYDWFMTWYAFIRKAGDPLNTKWSAATPDSPDHLGPFDQTDAAENQNSFMSLSPGDAISVDLYFGRASWLGECDLIRTTAGTLSTVTVILDVAYPLATESATWGKIKALYK